MPKIPITIEPTRPPERRRTKAIRTACIVAVGLMLAVPIMEAASLCIGQWCEVLERTRRFGPGTRFGQRRPAIDAPVHQFLAVRSVSARSLGPRVRAAGRRGRHGHGDSHVEEVDPQGDGNRQYRNATHAHANATVK